METFDSIPNALGHVVNHLIDRGNAFIVNIRGPREVASATAATIQLIPESYVLENAGLGLALHLPFDASSDTFDELVRFIGEGCDENFVQHRKNGITCFEMIFGRNVALATRVALFILERVYQYPAGTAFICEVSDEGASDAL